jgi:hypothetical protein
MLTKVHSKFLSLAQRLRARRTHGAGCGDATLLFRTVAGMAIFRKFSRVMRVLKKRVPRLDD